MKIPPTQEEVDAAKARWDDHAKRHATQKSNRKGASTLVWIGIVVVVALFLPTEQSSYDSAIARLRTTVNYLIYRVPCMAPESSFIDKWVRAKQVDCSKL